MSKFLCGCDVTFHEPIKAWAINGTSVDIYTVDTTVTKELPRKMSKKEVSDFLESEDGKNNIWKERFEKLIHSAHIEKEVKWKFNLNENLNYEQYQEQLISILDNL